jgi:hypothetical protein
MMNDEERLDHLERRVAFLEATLARLISLVLHPARGAGGRAKAKDKAAAVGSREVLEKAINAALGDLLERVELPPTERMAMPDAKLLRRPGSGPSGRPEGKGNG